MLFLDVISRFPGGTSTSYALTTAGTIYYGLSLESPVYDYYTQPEYRM